MFKSTDVVVAARDTWLKARKIAEQVFVLVGSGHELYDHAQRYATQKYLAFREAEYAAGAYGLA